MLRHNCGIAVANTLHDVYSFIHYLQHRGREAAGIAAIRDDGIDVLKWKGTVDRFDITDLHKIFPGTKYHTFFGHVRYATHGRKDQILEDAHPHVVGGTTSHRGDHVIIRGATSAIVHNGQVNPKFWLDKIDRNKLNSGCDTEALLHYFLVHNEKNLLTQIPGVYTLAIADIKRKDVVVLRDRHGVQPGVLGIKDGKYVVTSEDIAIRRNGANVVEDLDLGAAYYLAPDGSFKKENIVAPNPRHCFFQWNYLAHVDSVLDGVTVRSIRKGHGEVLARELSNVLNWDDIDVITFIPRCPEPAFRKLADAVGKRKDFRSTMYKISPERAFQGSTPSDRHDSITSNLHPLIEVDLEFDGEIKDCVVLVGDDSLIRANNSVVAIAILTEKCGVKEAILVEYTPPIGIIGADNVQRFCDGGVDFTKDDSYVALERDPDTKIPIKNRTLDEISKRAGARVIYISPKGHLSTFLKYGLSEDKLCTFCIGGPKPFEGFADTTNYV